MNNLLDSFSPDTDLIDIQSLDEENEQTWLHTTAIPGVENIDVGKWKNEITQKDPKSLEYKRNIGEMLVILDNMDLGSSKQKFDSRTYTRPKKKALRPSLYSVVSGESSGCSITNNNNTDFMCGTRTITKHSRNLTEEGRHTRANTNTITKHRNDFLTLDDDTATNYKFNGTFRLDSDDACKDVEYLDNHTVSKPININLSEPAHNLHNTFNKLVSAVGSRNSSIANMSPPSLVSSIAMDDSGAFNSSNFSRQGSVTSNKSINIKDNLEADEEGGTVHNSMDISILDEKEMSTSMLSHSQEDSLIGSPLPSMASSVESNLVNSITATPQGRSVMESSLINSGTFNSILEPIDDRLPNGQPKFQLRKSFLKPDPEDNFDKFLALNANCNTDDLRGLSEDFMKNVRSKYDTFRKGSEKENRDIVHNKDDSFLMGDGMSESFIKETGRESINITYNKLPLAPQRIRTVNRPQMEMENTIILPNQILSPRHQNLVETNCTFTKKINGTYDALPKERESPKRNATFRKLTPPSAANITTVLINTNVVVDNKDNMFNVVDSNKKCYMSANTMLDGEVGNKTLENSFEEKNEKHLSCDSQTRDVQLEGGDSRSSSPHHIVPLNMDDLEHLAYEQEQKLYQVVSTPISKPIPHNMGSADILFRQNVLSPIHNQPVDMMTSSSSSNISDSPTEPCRYGYNVSGIGSLNKLNASPKRSLPVKRESSAPEIKSGTPNSSRIVFSQKIGANRLQSGYASITQNNYHGPDEGVYTSRSAGGSPAKSLHSKQSGLQRPLGTAPPQLTGSDNELRLKKSGLPASKLRQYSSHKELNRIPGTPHSSAIAPINTLRPSSRLSFYASNPVLCPKPLVRQASYTIVSKDGTNVHQSRDFVKPQAPGLRPPSIPTTAGGVSYGQPLKARHSIGLALPSGNRPSTTSKVEAHPPSFSKTTSGPPSQSNLKSSSSSNTIPQRLPRPSGLPRPASGIPKRPSIRPPSTSQYSLAPRPNDQADCY